MPSVEATMWYLVPALPRSVGLGPISSPPRFARTEQLSTTTSQEVLPPDRIRAGSRSPPLQPADRCGRAGTRAASAPAHEVQRHRQVVGRAGVPLGVEPLGRHPPLAIR